MAAHAFRWSASSGIQDLGTLGGTESVAYGTNNLGHIVGDASTNGNAASHAFLWTPGTGMLDLGTLGGTRSVAYGVNDAGQVVGDSSLPNGQVHAFFWSGATGMVDLGTLLGGTRSTGRAINSHAASHR